MDKEDEDGNNDKAEVVCLSTLSYASIEWLCAHVRRNPTIMASYLVVNDWVVFHIILNG